MRILYVEENRDVVAIVSKILRYIDYIVDNVTTAAEADELVFVEEYDLLMLDRRLSDRDGIVLCRDLRKAGMTIPILMLSVLSDPEQRAEGLDFGADDYLGKPFHNGELVARIRTLLRRQIDHRSGELRVGDLVLDSARRVVCRNAERIELLPKEFAILEYLMRNCGVVRTQEQIGENVWGMEYNTSSNLIESYVSRLRRKIEREGFTRLIHTIKGVGYTVRDEA